MFTNAFIAGGTGPAFPADDVVADQLAVDDVSFTAVLASPAFVTLAHAFFSTGASVVAFVGAFLELAEVSGVSGFASAFAVYCADAIFGAFAIDVFACGTCPSFVANCLAIYQFTIHDFSGFAGVPYVTAIADALSISADSVEITVIVAGF